MTTFFDLVSQEPTTRIRRQLKRPDTSRDDVNRVVARRMLRAASGGAPKGKPTRIAHRWDCGCVGCVYTRTARQQGQLERRGRILAKTPTRGTTV
jgi:hypothetical protein